MLQRVFPRTPQLLGRNDYPLPGSQQDRVQIIESHQLAHRARHVPSLRSNRRRVRPQGIPWPHRIAHHTCRQRRGIRPRQHHHIHSQPHSTCGQQQCEQAPPSRCPAHGKCTQCRTAPTHTNRGTVAFASAIPSVGMRLRLQYAYGHRSHHPFEHLFYRTFVLSVAQMFESRNPLHRTNV